MSYSQSEVDDKKLKKIIKNSIKFNNIFESNILPIQVYHQDNNEIIVNLLKFIINKMHITEKKEEIINKISNIINIVLKDEHEDIKNEFYFLSKINLIISEGKEEEKLTNILYKNSDKNKILVFPHDNSDDYQDIDNNNDNELDLQNCKWNNKEKFSKLFNRYYECIYPFYSNIVLKLVDQNKLYIICNKTIYIYDLGNKKLDLITKREIYIQNLQQILILKNGNIALIPYEYKLSDKINYFYILHKNKLNIIDRIPLIADNYELSSLVELSDKSIVYIGYHDISIYKKINNNYIFSKIIYIPNNCLVRNRLQIFQFVENFFIIYDDSSLYNCSMKDYFIEKCLYNMYNCNKLIKINDDVVVLYGDDICHFIDLNIFTTINTRRMDGKINEIYHLTNNKFLISFKNTLSIGELIQTEHIYDFIYEYKINGYYDSFFIKNIMDSENGIIFYKNDGDWYITSMNSKLKIKLLNENKNLII